MFSWFHIGVPGLPNDAGRQRGVPRSERKCYMCSPGPVGDECHFVFVCPILAPVRACYAAWFTPSPRTFRPSFSSQIFLQCAIHLRLFSGFGVNCWLSELRSVRTAFSRQVCCPTRTVSCHNIRWHISDQELDSSIVVVRRPDCICHSCLEPTQLPAFTRGSSRTRFTILQRKESNSTAAKTMTVTAALATTSSTFIQGPSKPKSQPPLPFLSSGPLILRLFSPQPLIPMREARPGIGPHHTFQQVTWPET